MATIASYVKIDQERVEDALQEIANWLDRASGEVVLDFSSVQRINPRALQALEELAGIADTAVVTLELRGVNVGVYKVLKLAKLTPCFRFGNNNAHQSTTEQESCHAEPTAHRSSVLG
jgi:anti-anti-sigma regulatory factor